MRPPNEKAEQVRARIEARERELTDTATARASQQFALEKAQIEASAKATIEKLTGEAAAKEVAAREEGRKTAEAAMQEKLTAAEKAKAESEAAAQERIAAAEGAKLAAEAEAKTVRETHETLMNQRLQEQREILDRDKMDAVNIEKAQRADDTQKFTAKLADLTRQLEKKTADELGEGAEVKLLDALKEEFPDDKIEHTGKGPAGADIIHDVVHNGKICGRIVYDSKNRTAWRSDYVDKLARDQIAAKAEHAILSALKFPADARQLHVQDGVIIANPARVVAIVHVIRKHIVQVNALRLSKSERARKMAALYDFITSERCGQLLQRIDDHAENLLDLQGKEKKQHDANWKRQGTLCRSIQKVRAELSNEIDLIIGTADAAE